MNGVTRKNKSVQYKNSEEHIYILKIRKLPEIQNIPNCQVVYLQCMLINRSTLLYPHSGISMDEEIVLGDMIWSYNKAEL